MEVGGNQLLLENPEKMPDIFRFIADRRISVLRMERQEPTLEDLFMEVIGK